MAEFHDDEVYPPSASAGGINAYYLEDCEVVGHRPSYCVCLNKIKAYERDRTLRGLQCESEIRDKTCPALKLRDKERDAGVALFFINRVKLQAFNDEQVKITRDKLVLSKVSPKKSSLGSVFIPKNEMPPAPPPLPPKKKEEHFLDQQGGYAAAINNAMKELEKPAPVAKPEPAVQPALKPAVQQAPTTVAPKSGMSLLEMARMQLAAKAS